MKNIKHFLDLIKKSQHIVISTHIHPDADGIGSQIALCMALKSLKKDAYCVNEEKLLDRYSYLDNNNYLLSFNEYQKKCSKIIPDLTIIVDTNHIARIGPNLEKIAAKSKVFIFIDHHPCPKEVAAIHLIDTKMAATGELVAVLLEKLGVAYNKDLALPLYTAILIDTNCFRYPNVTFHTHKIVSDLMQSGVAPASAYNSIYGTKKIHHMKLLGQILSQAETNKDESVAWITLTEEMIKKNNSDIEDTHSFINHLLILDNVKVSCMFRETGKFIKVSLRSTGTTDVGTMAQALGGGGHDHSAATIIEGGLEDVIKNTIRKIEIMLK